MCSQSDCLKSIDPTCDKISMIFEVSADAINDSTDVARCNSVKPPDLLLSTFRSLPAGCSTGKMLRILPVYTEPRTIRLADELSVSQSVAVIAFASRFACHSQVGLIEHWRSHPIPNALSRVVSAETPARTNGLSAGNEALLWGDCWCHTFKTAIATPSRVSSVC